MARIFVVTGGNKGIGRSVVKLLLQDKTEKVVYLTSRNAELGQKTVEEFISDNMHPKFHQLDITDKESVEALRDYLVKAHGGFDVLVNNAGIAYKGASTAPFSEQAHVTNTCNFFGTLQTCEILFPILRNNARVVHVSSMSSQFAYPKMSASWRSKFGDVNLTMDELKSYISQFIAAAQEDRVEEIGFPKSAYGMSKIGVSMMAIIQQKEANKNSQNLVVNACCPGLVDTDMTGGKYPNAIPTDEGADTPAYLALLEENTDIKGCFVSQRTVRPYPPCT